MLHRKGQLIQLFTIFLICVVLVAIVSVYRPVVLWNNQYGFFVINGGVLICGGYAFPWERSLSGPYLHIDSNQSSVSWWSMCRCAQQHVRVTAGGNLYCSMICPLWVIIAGCGVLMLALRSRHRYLCVSRRLCVECGYDLRGTQGEVCSECGLPVPEEGVGRWPGWVSHRLRMLILYVFLAVGWAAINRVISYQPRVWWPIEGRFVYFLNELCGPLFWGIVYCWPCRSLELVNGVLYVGYCLSIWVLWGFLVLRTRFGDLSVVAHLTVAVLYFVLGHFIAGFVLSFFY